MSNARKLADNLPTEGSLSGRNMLINGDMSLSQRIGTTATAITGGSYGLDRWGMYYSGNTYTTQQVTDAPSGFYNSMKLLVTGTTTPNYSFFGQRIEGLNVNHIGLGTANCQSFTVSFYVKSSVAGVYSISMTNGAGDLAYPIQYTINSANTWERKTMTIPPITSGTWARDNTNGLYLRINLGSPSGRTDTSGAWSSGNFDGADGSTGAVTWATTSGATFYMTGCQLEVGPQSTPFEHEPVGVTLSKCQRYFQHHQGNYYTIFLNGSIDTTSAYLSGPLTQVMRAKPSFSTANCYLYARPTGNLTYSSTENRCSTDFATIGFHSISGSISNSAGMRFESNNSNGYVRYDAEL